MHIGCILGVDTCHATSSLSLSHLTEGEGAELSREEVAGGGTASPRRARSKRGRGGGPPGGMAAFGPRPGSAPAGAGRGGRGGRGGRPGGLAEGLAEGLAVVGLGLAGGAGAGAEAGAEQPEAGKKGCSLGNREARVFAGRDAGPSGQGALRSGDVDRGGEREPGNVVLQLRQWLAVHRQLHRPPLLTLLRALCAGLPPGGPRGRLGLPQALEARVGGGRPRTPSAAAGGLGASADEILLKKLGKLADSLGPGDFAASLDVSLLRLSAGSDAGDDEGSEDEDMGEGASAMQRWAAQRRRAIQRAAVKKELMRRAVLMPRENYDDTDEGGFRRSSSDGVWLPAPKSRPRTPSGAEEGGTDDGGGRVCVLATEFGEAWRLMCQKEEASGKRPALHRPLSGRELETLFRKYGVKQRNGTVTLDVLEFAELVTGSRDSAGSSGPSKDGHGRGGFGKTPHSLRGPPLLGDDIGDAKIFAPPCRSGLSAPNFFDGPQAESCLHRPFSQLQLEYCYGYNAEVRHSVLLTRSGSILFPCAALCVLAKTSGGRAAGGKCRTKQEFFMGHDDDVTAVALDTSRTRAASGQMGSTPYVCVWDTARKQELARLPCRKGSRAIEALGFCKSGRFVAAVAADNRHEVHIWDWQKQMLVFCAPTVPGEPGYVRGLVWNTAPGGNEDAFLTFGVKHIKFWQPGEDTLGAGATSLWECRLPQWGGAKMADVNCATFLPTGLVATGHPSGDLYLWKNCRVVRTVSMHPAPGGKGLCSMKLHVNKVEGTVALISAGGDGAIRRTLLTGASSTAKVEAALHAAGAAVAPFSKLPESSSGRPQQICSVDFLSGPNGQYRLAAGTRLGDVWEVKQLDRGSAGGNRGREAGGEEAPLASEVGKGKGQVFSNGGKEKSATSNSLDTSIAAADTRLVTEGHAGKVTSSVFSPDLPYIFATGSYLGEVALWNAISHRRLHTFRFSGRVSAIAFRPKSHELAVGLERGTLLIFDARVRGPPLHKIRCGQQRLSVLQYSPDGSALAVGSAEMDVHLLRPGNQYRRFAHCTGHSGTVTAVDFSADGSVIQSCSNAYEILFFDVKTGRLLVQPQRDTKWASWTMKIGFPVMGIWTEADGSNINSVCVNPAGDLLATSDDYGYVTLFNYPTVFKGAVGDKSGGHAAHVMQVRFNSDGRWLISAGRRDKAALQWKVVKRETPLQPLAVPSARAISISERMLRREPAGNEYARKRLLLLEEELRKELAKAQTKPIRKVVAKAPAGKRWGALDGTGKTMGWLEGPEDK